MQLYAYDHNKNLILAKLAQKHLDYSCFECGNIVRLRAGKYRQPHFFHLLPNRKCLLSQKSLNHIQTQCYLQKIIPAGSCFLEVRFPKINRIADAVWEREKLIFEVQCSPITKNEVEERNRDYESLGYSVVWILHDKRFNKKRACACEDFLQRNPHYFTNIDAIGRGFIYDQVEIIEKGLRLYSKRVGIVNIANPKRAFTRPKSQNLPKNVIFRLYSWPIFFEGDLLDGFINDDKLYKDIIANALEIEQKTNIKKSKTAFGSIKKLFFSAIVKPYLVFFRYLLETNL